MAIEVVINTKSAYFGAAMVLFIGDSYYSIFCCTHY